MARVKQFSQARKALLIISGSLAIAFYLVGMFRWIALEGSVAINPAFYTSWIVLAVFTSMVTLLIYFWQKWWDGFILTIILTVFFIALIFIFYVFFPVQVTA